MKHERAGKDADGRPAVLAFDTLTGSDVDSSGRTAIA
jgi:hypothetical protein